MSQYFKLPRFFTGRRSIGLPSAHAPPRPTLIEALGALLFPAPPQPVPVPVPVKIRRSPQSPRSAPPTRGG